MILGSIRNRIRNKKSRTTSETARDSMYATHLQTVTRWLGTESNRRHADFQSLELVTLGDTSRRSKPNGSIAVGDLTRVSTNSHDSSHDISHDMYRRESARRARRRVVVVETS